MERKDLCDVLQISEAHSSEVLDRLELQIRELKQEFLADKEVAAKEAKAKAESKQAAIAAFKSIAAKAADAKAAKRQANAKPGRKTAA
eukprot:4859678-Pyramimonas_sp.AAC.1